MYKATSVRNLRSWFYERFTIETHINKVWKMVFITCIISAEYLSHDSAETLVHAFITIRLDYCNSLLFGLPHYQLAKPQRVCRYRLICRLRKFCHISPVLATLHWPPINYRIEFKILLIMF